MRTLPQDLPEALSPAPNGAWPPSPLRGHLTLATAQDPLSDEALNGWQMAVDKLLPWTRAPRSLRGGIAAERARAEYLRAHYGLAECLLVRGAAPQSIIELHALIARGRTAHLPARIALVLAHVTAGQLDQAALVRRRLTNDVGALWAYTDLLYRYVAGGNTLPRTLNKALASNGHVPARLAKAQFDATWSLRHLEVRPGSSSEADVIASSLVGHLWRVNPAALAWLEAQARIRGFLPRATSTRR